MAFFWLQLTGNRDPCTYWKNGGREPTGPPRPLPSQFKAEVNMSPASPLWTATSTGNIRWVLPFPLFDSASDMAKRANQVCNEMWGDRNFLKAAEIVSVFYTENFLNTLCVLTGCVLRVNIYVSAHSLKCVAHPLFVADIKTPRFRHRYNQLMLLIVRSS